MRYFEARDAAGGGGVCGRGAGADFERRSGPGTCAVGVSDDLSVAFVRKRCCFVGVGVRYKLVGGISFYNRAEVKDTLAYVRLALHPEG